MEVIIEDAEAKDFSNVGGMFDCTNVMCSVKIAPQEVAEKFQVTLGSIIIQPTFANEEREIKFIVGNATGLITFFNITISQINENQIFFDMLPVGIAESVEIEIEGAKVQALHVNGINHTFTFTAQGAGNNKIVIDDIETTPNNVTAFFTQTPDIQFATFGRSLEGNFTNTITQEQEEILYNYLELYNPNTNSVRLIKEDLKVDQQRAYEIIGKINVTGFYPTDLVLEKGGSFYKDLYSNSTSITDFFNNLRQKVVDTVDQVIVGDGD